MRITTPRLMIATAALGALLLTGCSKGGQTDAAATTPASTAPIATASAAAPAASAAVTASASAAAPATDAEAPTTPVVNSTIGGTFFYYDTDNNRYVAVRDGKSTTILRGADVYYIHPSISPDGSKIAWVAAKDRRVWVAGTDGTGARNLGFPVNEMAMSLTWTADSKSVITAEAWKASAPLYFSTIRVSDGKATQLPSALQSGLHYRMTPDGKRYFFLADKGVIYSAKVDGTGKVKTPVVGDPNSAANPQQLQGIDIISSDRTGSRITANVLTTFERENPKGSPNANMLIDTATGKVIPVPVKGAIRQLLLKADGTLLVRSGSATSSTLTLFDAGLKVLSTKKEAAATTGLILIDYRR
ncbi:TolB family protein [Actinoplanes palleronii]|uniref:WD40 repeat protein n=1 Tax=Actinoplanes palleronii TaxID=113570 RepID=A0ABQ4B733_9ACTN|nr:hypothetical protein [Actinoplanes palleronii]GIE66499.1 hypothetical protein Apa02nite_026070 [Actinoplanes palleronii]